MKNPQKHEAQRAQGRQGEPSEAVRLADVAAAAGVGIATASRALNNPGRVSAKARDKVIAAARELGYTTNIAARSLRSGSSRIVLVIMPPWEGFGVLETALRGIDAALMQAGYSMIVSTLTKDRATDPRIIETARGGFVDGILAVTNQPLADGGLPILSARMPTVGLLIDLSSYGVPSIVVAERDATRALTERLIARGRRRLLYIGGMPGYHDVERRAGFDDATRSAGPDITAEYVEGDYSAASGVRAAEAFLAMADRPDGVVCTNDHMAVAFMDTLRKAGVRVPQDVAVTGFDDADLASYCMPPLTTCRQPMGLMGAEAARMLLTLIAGEAQPLPVRVMFPGELVLRESD